MLGIILISATCLAVGFALGVGFLTYRMVRMSPAKWDKALESLIQHRESALERTIDELKES